MKNGEKKQYLSGVIRRQQDGRTVLSLDEMSERDELLVCTQENEIRKAVYLYLPKGNADGALSSHVSGQEEGLSELESADVVRAMKRDFH